MIKAAPVVRAGSLLLWGACLAVPAGVASATVEPRPEGVEFFEKNIRPVLVERCYKCHSDEAGKAKGGLWLDSRDGLREGGDSGPALIPGQPGESLLIEAIRHAEDGLQMPPKEEPLSAEQVAHFEEWVNMGAPDPRTRAGAASGAAARIDFDKARQFWSFRPVADPPLPVVSDRAWPSNPVDYFILAGLEARDLSPVAPADKRTLIRRATFDLIGLPPTPEEVDAFLADDSTNAFETVVDGLLASPHYGERWGRHWLDLARYADTSGCNSDYPVPSAYKYRNYVIDSFNRDKPFDQFVREQIAGDLLPAESEARNHEQSIATGYLAISRRFGSRAAEFHLTIEDTIDNVGKTVLGLSVSCARCHDHKFDPIPTRDYYALYGIFSSTKYAFPGTEIYRHTKDFIPLAPPEEAAKFREFEAEVAALDDQIEKLVQEKKPLAAAAKKGEAPAPGSRTLEQVKADLDDAKTQLLRLEAKPPVVEKAYAVAEGTPGSVKVHRKGDPKSPGEEVPRGFLQVLGGQRLPPEATGSGRLELARWLTDPDNPLTARVMVNRIWQHHFGKGIVPTPNDFGARGRPPTHPELLDYLATRFVEDGWSVKALHKRIMLSRAYQLSGADDSEATRIDGANDYLWRFDRRRLSAEEIRDAMLAVAGALDGTKGGEHPFPPEMDWRYTQHKAFVATYETNRRSVYLMQQRIRRQPFLEVFDGADPNATTAARPLSTTAVQALFLMNSPFAHDQADAFAVRVGMACVEEPERIDYAHRLVFGRPASEEEIQVAHDFLGDCRDQLKATDLPWDRRSRSALASYTRMLFSSNEFLFVD